MWAPIWPGLDNDHRPVRAITNGIHVPTWLSLEMAALLDDYLPADWRDRVDEPSLWEAVARIPDERVWETRQALRTYLFAFLRERARQLLEGRTRHRRTRRRGRDAPRPERADDRLRAAVHRLQAIGADLPRPRTPGGHPDRGAPAGSAGLRRQGPSGRRDGQAQHPEGLPPRDRFDVRRPRRLRRRLRPPRRALPRAGLRRLAEQPAQAARSVRHERNEGLDQRRAAPEHRRRLVGGRLCRPERLADRRAAAERRSRRGRRRRRRSALSAPRARGRADLLRPRRPGHPAALVRHRPAGHPDRHAEILGATHGQGVRRHDVRAGHPARARPSGRP